MVEEVLRTYNIRKLLTEGMSGGGVGGRLDCFDYLGSQTSPAQQAHDTTMFERIEGECWE